MSGIQITSFSFDLSTNIMNIVGTEHELKNHYLELSSRGKDLLIIPYSWLAKKKRVAGAVNLEYFEIEREFFST